MWDSANPGLSPGLGQLLTLTIWALHLETRDLPVYDLTAAKSGLKLPAAEAARLRGARGPGKRPALTGPPQIWTGIDRLALWLLTGLLASALLLAGELVGSRRTR